MVGKDVVGERLDSWKEIAAYLGRDVRTVIRWEKDKGLPVRRVPGGHRKSVFAYRSELDAWLDGSRGTASPGPNLGAETAQEEKNPVHESPRRLVLFAKSFILGTELLALFGVAFWLWRSARGRDAPQATAPVQITRNGTRKADVFADDSHVFFVEHLNGQTVLSQVAIEGGEIRHVPTPFRYVDLLGISTSRNALLVSSYEGIEVEKPLWIVQLSGGAPIRVGSIRCHAAAWSPDGRTIAFSNGTGLYISDDEGARVSQLGTYSAVPRMLRWADSGRTLRFALQDDVSGEPSFWTIGVDRLTHRSSTPQKLKIGVENCCRAWDELGNFPFYILAGGVSEGMVWAVRKSPDGETSLMSPALVVQGIGEVESLAVSGMSDRIVVNSRTASESELLRLDARSGRFSPYLPDIDAHYIDFSPDGARIAYVKLTDRTLWISGVDGRQARQLTLTPMEVELPRWSPDGNLVAFMGKRSGKSWRIFVMSLADGALREATEGNENQGAPTWSPDGRYLAYGNVGCQESHTCAIQIADLSTGNIERLPHSESLRTARWSPNGRYIAAMQPEEHRVLVFDTHKKQWNALTNETTGDDLAWSRDSRFVYTVRSAVDRAYIVRVSVPSGEEKRVADLADFGKLAGLFSPWFCLAPDGSLVLHRHTESSEIYAIEWRSD